MSSSELHHRHDIRRGFRHMRNGAVVRALLAEGADPHPTPLGP